MELKEQDLNTMDSYWKGKLSEKNKLAFETRLKQEAGLTETYQQYINLRQGVAYTHLWNQLEKLREVDAEYFTPTSSEEPNLGSLITDATRLEKNQALLEQFQNIETEIEEEGTIITPEKRSRSTFYSRVAVGFLLLIIASFLFYLNQKSVISEQQLATALFETYPHQYGVRDNKISDIKTAFSNYDFGAFEVAIPQMEKIIQKEKTPILNFHLAVAYLGNNEIDKSISLFSEIQSDLPNMKDQINWYLGLCYLQKEEMKIAKKHFLTIKNYKKATVKKLLEQLD